MPVFREQKSGFFQNPFSQGYQKLWRKAKETTENRPYVDEARQTLDPRMQSMVVEQPTGKMVSARSSKGILERPAGPKGTTKTAMSPPRTQVRQAPAQAQTRKPAQRHPVERPAVQAATAKAAGPQVRVIHVDDVNEGTPAVGTILEVDQPDPAILESLAEGEKIVTVTERVIGIYRDGKLVTVSESNPTVRHRVLKPGTKREVDPWFGDMIAAPSEEVQSLQEPADVEALPPQSLYEEPATPELPMQELAEMLDEEVARSGYSVNEETVEIIEPTGYVLPMPQVSPAPAKATRRPTPPTPTKPTRKGWR